jgi:hypothetical protein
MVPSSQHLTIATARSSALVYYAIASEIDGNRFLSRSPSPGWQAAAPDKRPECLGVIVFQLGYHSAPSGGLMSGSGHVELDASLGWAD